jgi:hypothetical protein
LAFLHGNVQENRLRDGVVEFGELDVRTALRRREIGRVDVRDRTAEFETSA